MKHYYFILLFLFPLSLIAQENNAELWEKANIHFTSEEYQEAISVYEQILQSGEESAKLYFNLGNAYYKAGDVNNAILNYERAKILAPHDEDIEFNLRIANQFVVTKIEELPQPFFLRWRTSLVNTYPADTWSVYSISAFIIFLILLGLFFFSKSVQLKRLAFLTGILAIIISGFTYSFASQQKKKIVERNHAIVFCPRITVKSSPTQSGTDLFLIYEGLKVEISDSLNNWKEIKLADGNEGWLPDSCIVKI